MLFFHMFFTSFCLFSIFEYFRPLSQCFFRRRPSVAKKWGKQTDQADQARQQKQTRQSRHTRHTRQTRPEQTDQTDETRADRPGRPDQTRQTRQARQTSPESGDRGDRPGRPGKTSHRLLEINIGTPSASVAETFSTFSALSGWRELVLSTIQREMSHRLLESM